MPSGPTYRKFIGDMRRINSGGVCGEILLRPETGQNTHDGASSSSSCVDTKNDNDRSCTQIDSLLIDMRQAMQLL